MKTKLHKKVIILFITFTFILSACNNLATPPQTTPSPESMPTETIPDQATPNYVIEETPSQEASLTEADRILAFGDYEEALKLYSANTSGSSPELQAAALYGQGLTYYKQGDLFQAQRTLNQLQNQFPESLPAKRANFILAQINLDQDNDEAALTFYQAYANAQAGVLDAEISQRIGSLLSEKGDTEAALEAFRTAYLAPQLSHNTTAALNLAQSYTTLGESDLALGIYKETLYNTSSDYTKASMNLLIGRILINQGKTEEAYTYLQDSVNNYPQTYDAYTALVTLIDAEQTVNELQRGIINYNVQQYNLANEAFDRYLESDGYDKDEALYYKALSVRASGLVKAGSNSAERLAANASGGMEEDKEAIRLWRELIDTYPTSDYRFDAIEDIIYTQNAYMGQLNLAIETTLAFVAAPNSAPDAPALLKIAANYYFLDGKLKEAADCWTRIALEFPASTDAFNGLFFGGSFYYEIGEYDKAYDNFNRAVLVANPGTLEEYGTHFWLGKVNLAMGKPETAKGYWETTVNLDPHGYYGIRATEMLNDQSLFPQLNLNLSEPDLENERLIAADWLKTAFNLPTGINVDYSSEIAESPFYQRGMEYHRLGIYSEASQEFSTLQDTYSQDALNSFRLIKAFLDLGYYNLAIEASRAISKLAGYGDFPLSSNYPPYFAHVQYGLYYFPYVQEVSNRYDIPEIFLYSLIQQESRFAAHAWSSAGASGLMQLMPETAAQIASETGYPPNFKQSDLAIPMYNLALGSNYLARQIYVFKGDSYHALAAYNSGPGATLRWTNLIGDDPDVFLNSINYLETRTYLRKIVENYHIYSLIYGK